MPQPRSPPVLAILCFCATTLCASASAGSTSCVILAHTKMPTSITPLQTFTRVANTDACCELCNGNPACDAWVVTAPCSPLKAKQASCKLYRSLAGAVSSVNDSTVTTGRRLGATTHFGNPIERPCLAGELNLSFPAYFNGSWCAPMCSTDGAQPCPTDVPNGVTATPSCVIKDPFGDSRHCAMTNCTNDEDCGPGSNSRCQIYAGAGICTYVGPSTVHECSGHGHYVNDTVHGFVGCACDYGWVGKLCDTAICSGHGVIYYHACICDEGWSGPNCGSQTATAATKPVLFIAVLNE